MKKILLLLLVLVSIRVQSQNEIRLISDKPDCVIDLLLSDTNDYITNIGFNNLVTSSYDSSVIAKIGKDGAVLKNLYFGECFENTRVHVEKILKIESNRYVALANFFYDNIQMANSKLLYFDDELNITSVKSLGDTSVFHVSGSIMKDSRNQLVVGGYKYHHISNVYYDSITVKVLSMDGALIKETSFEKDTLVSPHVRDIVELPYYEKYVVAFRSTMIRLIADSSLVTAKFVFNSNSGCTPGNSLLQISDKKFMEGVNIVRCNPDNGDDYPNDVGYLIADTTSMPLFAPEEVYQNEIFKFGELNNHDVFCGLDFVAPDTSYLSFMFADTTVSSNFITTLQKTTLNGTVIWRKNYMSDANRWLKVKAIDGGILLYGVYWFGLNSPNLNPIIIRLNSNGEVESTTDIHFRQVELLAYPNPTNYILNLKLENSKGNYHALKIMNILNQSVYETSLSLNNNDLDMKIDVSGFAKGTYFVQLIGTNRQIVKKIVVN